MESPKKYTWKYNPDYDSKDLILAVPATTKDAEDSNGTYATQEEAVEAGLTVLEAEHQRNMRKDAMYSDVPPVRMSPYGTPYLRTATVETTRTKSNGSVEKGKLEMGLTSRPSSFIWGDEDTIMSVITGGAGAGEAWSIGAVYGVDPQEIVVGDRDGLTVNAGSGTYDRVHITRQNCIEMMEDLGLLDIGRDYIAEATARRESSQRPDAPLREFTQSKISYNVYQVLEQDPLKYQQYLMLKYPLTKFESQIISSALRTATYTNLNDEEFEDVFSNSENYERYQRSTRAEYLDLSSKFQSMTAKNMPSIITSLSNQDMEKINGAMIEASDAPARFMKVASTNVRAAFGKYNVDDVQEWIRKTGKRLIEEREANIERDLDTIHSQPLNNFEEKLILVALNGARDMDDDHELEIHASDESLESFSHRPGGIRGTYSAIIKHFVKIPDQPQISYEELTKNDKMLTYAAVSAVVSHERIMYDKIHMVQSDVLSDESGIATAFQTVAKKMSQTMARMNEGHENAGAIESLQRAAKHATIAAKINGHDEQTQIISKINMMTPKNFEVVIMRMPEKERQELTQIIDSMETPAEKSNVRTAITEVDENVSDFFHKVGRERGV